MVLRAFALALLACCLVAQNSDSGFSSRNPRYQLQPGDVLEVSYRYTPEFNQTVTIQPDGFVSLNLVGDVTLAGATLGTAHSLLTEKSSSRLREPEISLVLKEFVGPHFFVAGEVARPGRFDLRGPVSALQAVAMAGGLKHSARHSQAILYRRIGGQTAEAQLVNLKNIATPSGIREDIELRSGDVLFVPQNRISKIERIVRWGNWGVYASPLNR